jgi:hypothetical protein
MTKRKDDLRRRTFDDLLEAVDSGDKSAKAALSKYQDAIEAGGKPEIWSSPHHGWRITDPAKG